MKPTADHIAARELYQYTINDGELYRRHTLPIIENLRKKAAQGLYRPDLALRLWAYLITFAAKKYVQEFDSSRTPARWHALFNAATRREAARAVAYHYAGALTRSNPAGRRRTARDRNALRFAFASLSPAARRRWRSVRPPLPRPRARRLVRQLAGIKVNPPGPGPFVLRLGPDWICGLQRDGSAFRLRLDPDRRRALRLNRLGTARMLRLLRRHQNLLRVRIEPA